MRLFEGFDSGVIRVAIRLGFGCFGSMDLFFEKFGFFERNYFFKKFQNFVNFNFFEKFQFFVIFHFFQFFNFSQIFYFFLNLKQI